MNETSAFRRVAATLTIGSFTIAALMGIYALLGAGDFGETEARILLTTLVVGCTSICVLCYLATAGTRWAAVGAFGGFTAILPTVTALVLVWSDWDGGDAEPLVQTFGVGVVVAVTFAQVCLLLVLAGQRRQLALVLWATVAMSAAVAALVSALITEVIDEDIWKLLGVVAILDVLGTLVTIALAKFGGTEEGSPAPGRVRATLSAAHSAAISERSRATGRPAEELIDEALAQYLSAESGSPTRI